MALAQVFASNEMSKINGCFAIFATFLQFCNSGLYFFSRKMSEASPVWGRLIFLRPSGRIVTHRAAKKKHMILAQKNSQDIEKLHRKSDLTRLRAGTNIPDQTDGTEEVLNTLYFKYRVVAPLQRRLSSVGCPL